MGVCLALEPLRLRGRHLSRTRPRPGQGNGSGAACGGDAGPRDGVCGGRAGSMNVIDLEHGLVGCFGIVGGSIAAATGAAVTAKRSGRVAVAFFGDGAVNQGYFHECLNFAKVLDLPAVFVCENNFYGEFTPMEQVTAGRDIAARGAAFGVPSLVVDGNDVVAVHAAAQDAVAPRRGRRPSLLECQTYRHYGHSKSDPAVYRPQEEVERWLERDPLVVARMRLTELGVSDEDLDQAAASAKERMAQASEAALGLPIPTPRPTGPPSSPGEPLSGQTRVPGRDPRRAGRGDGARRVGDLLRRGRRRRGRRLHGHAGAARALRRGAGLRHPYLRAGPRGSRVRGGGHGLRPVFEIMFGDFMGLPMDSLANQAAKFWYVSNEQEGAAGGALGGGRGRPLRGHSLPVPRHLVPGNTGLKIVSPSTPAEAKGLLKAAIRDDNPVLFLEHKRLYSVKGPPPQDGDVPALGQARVAREGADVTLVSIAKGVPDSLAAAETGRARHRRRGDRPALRPLDLDTVLRSVAKTNRLVALEEGPGSAAGRPAWWARWGPRPCTTSTTSGSSPPTSCRFPTARRSRTRSCRARTRSPMRCAGAWTGS